MALWETNGQTNVPMENLPILQDTAAQRACLKPVSAPKLAHMEIAIKSELKCIEIYFSNLDIKLLNRAFWAVQLWYHIGEILVSIFLFLPPSHTPWLASQALQLASKTSGWPLIHLAGLPEPLANLLTLHLASVILSLILWLASRHSDPQAGFSDP